MKTALRTAAQSITHRVNRNTGRIVALAGLGVVLAGAAVTANASDARFSSFWQPSNQAHGVAEGQIVDVQIRVEGRDAPLFFRPNKFSKHYFQAFEGQNYSLVLTNKTGRRIGVLMAVDGVNVVNGERSRLKRGEPMYVLDPWEQATINGWRSSMKHIQRFVFVDEERSYAERTGQANADMGWIRVHAFKEKHKQRAWWERPKYKDWRDGRRRAYPERSKNQRPSDDRDEYRGGESRGDAAPESDAPSAKREGKAGLESFENESRQSVPGTGWGTKRYDPVQRTTFLTAGRATDKISFRYEYASGLRALGIFPNRNRLWEREHGQLGFAKPPRW